MSRRRTRRLSETSEASVASDRVLRSAKKKPIEAAGTSASLREDFKTRVDFWNCAITSKDLLEEEQEEEKGIQDAMEREVDIDGDAGVALNRERPPNNNIIAYHITESSSSRCTCCRVLLVVAIIIAAIMIGAIIINDCVKVDSGNESVFKLDKLKEFTSKLKHEEADKEDLSDTNIQKEAMDKKEMLVWIKNEAEKILKAHSKQNEAAMKKEFEALKSEVANTLSKLEKDLKSRPSSACSQTVLSLFGARKTADEEDLLVKLNAQVTTYSSGEPRHNQIVYAIKSTFGMVHMTPHARIVIQERKMRINQCWQIFAFPGIIRFKLQHSARIRGFGVSHMRLDNGLGLEQAPKVVSLFGLSNSTANAAVHLATLQYEIKNKLAKQTLMLTKPSQDAYQLLEMHILSNHGADSTCLYRLHVY